MLRTVCERFSAGTVAIFFELMTPPIPLALLYKLLSASDSVTRRAPPAGSLLDFFFFNFRGTTSLIVAVVLSGDMLVARACLLVSAGWRYRVC